jgi:archaellum component FlaC
MTPEQYVQKLIELSLQKLDAINEIFELTKKQSEIINEDSADKLQKLIELKQKQIDNIGELDEAFEVYFARLKSTLGIQSIDEIRMTQLQGAAELKQIVTIISEIYKKIQTLEIENKNRTEEIVNKLASEIRKIKQHKMANNGYNIASKLPNTSYFIDKRK